MEPPIQGWNLLKYRNLVRHATSKQIKKFIKSLDVRLLKQIIAIYISTIVTPQQRDYKQLTATQSLRHWKETEKNQNKDTLCPKDAEILKSLHKYCKYKKPNIYQNESKLLNCIPMEILAYSFSFLSFQQLSAIQSVCLYFMKASRKYSHLAHHHLSINNNFITKLTFNQINLSLLTHFQSIIITNAYVSRKMYVFKYIMNHIISHSSSSLQSLTINIHRAGNRMKCVVLDLILNAADFFPALRSIYWRADCCSRVIDYDSLRATIHKKVHPLRDLEIHNWTGGIIAGIHSILNYSIPNPFYLTLTSLHLRGTQFLATDIIPNILQHMKQLTDLHIDIYGRSVLGSELRKESLSQDILHGNAKLILSKHKTGFINTSIRKLHLRFGIPSLDTPALLIYFFLHCVNVRDLTLDLSRMQTDWCLLFDLLMEQKANYGDAAAHLSKITISANQRVSICVLDALNKTVSIQPQIKRLTQIHIKLHILDRSTFPNLDQWTNITMRTMNIFDELQTFNVYMPWYRGRYRGVLAIVNMFDINWNRGSLSVANPIYKSKSDFYRHLTELDLRYFDHAFVCRMIPIVLQTVLTLTKLSIAGKLPNSRDIALANDFKDEQSAFHHPSLNTLNLALSFNTRRYNVPTYSIAALSQRAQYILRYFFNICPHLTDLSLYWNISVRNEEKLSIEWKKLFVLMNENKKKHCAEYLSRLSVKCSNENHILADIMEGLIMTKNCIQYLKHVALNQDDGFKLNHDLLKRFLKIADDENGRLVTLNMETWHDNYQEYGEYIVMLLQNVPASLEHLNLVFSFMYQSCAWWKPKCKNGKHEEYDDISWKIVKCLINLSVNKNGNMKTIDFEKLCILNKAKEYLKFYFGFQNKLICDSDYSCKIILRS